MVFFRRFPATHTVATYDELRALPGFAGETMAVGGRSAIGDGGEGSFYFDSVTAADDDGSVLSAVGGGCWRRVDRTLTPQMFGATGDGVTDDTAAITAMFASADGGRPVHFPRGTYVFSDRFEPPSNIVISGDGENTVLFRKALSFDPTSISSYRRGGCFAFIQKSKVHIRDLVIDGNKDNQSLDTFGYSYGIGIWMGNVEPSSIPSTYTNATTNVVIERVTIRNNLGHAFSGGGATDIKLLQCNAYDTGHNPSATASPFGAVFVEYTDNIQILGGEYLRNHHGDIEFWSNCKNSVIRGVRAGRVVVNNNAAGHHDAYHAIEDNDIDNSTCPLEVACIEVNYANQVVVRGNRLRVATSSGIATAAGSTASYKGLIFANNQVQLTSALQCRGITISEWEGGVCSGNTIVGKFYIGLTVETCSNVSAANNTIVGDSDYIPGVTALSSANKGFVVCKRSHDNVIAGNAIRGYYVALAEMTGSTTDTNTGADASYRNTFVNNDASQSMIKKMFRGLGTADEGCVGAIADLRNRPFKPALDALGGGLTDVAGAITALGLTTENDGGGGVFNWVMDTATADDGCNNIVCTTTPRTGLWRRAAQCRGETDVASASTISPPAGEWHKITGTTAVNYISTARAWKGQVQEFYVTNAAGLTFNNNAGAVPAGTASILTSTGANVAVAQRGTFRVRYDGTNWLHV